MTGYDAIMLLGFGGPEGPDEVVPFLKRVTAGRGIPDERLVEVGEHYFTLGGVSPLNAQNRALRDALSDAIAQRLPSPMPIVLAHRNSAPLVLDVLRELVDTGARRILGVATATYSGYSACRQYREDLALAQQALQAEHPELALDLRKMPPYYDIPAFATTIAALAQSSLPSDVDLASPTTRIVFTTHSIPTSMASASGPDGDGYLSQHRWVAERVVGEIQRLTGVTKEWDLVFQSRSGPPHIPWLEPDVNDALASYARDGADTIILIPLGFISDHMEVIWDLDTQARQSAHDLDLRLVRTPTVGTHPAFVADLADRIVATISAGPTEACPGDSCYGDCCLNPRSQSPAAPSAAPTQGGQR